MSYRVERLGHLGDGVADGPVYIARALPGEVVTGTVIDGRIDDTKVVTPSRDRVAAPCSHYRSCGGCALQHASDSFVSDWKVAVVRRALASHDIAIATLGVSTSPVRSRRRATLSGRRTKSGAIVGFHQRASDAIISVPTCRLLHPDLIAVLPALERIVAHAGARKEVLRLALATSGAGIDIAVRGGGGLGAQDRAELAQIAERFGVARLTWSDDLIVEFEPPWQAFGSVRVVVPSGAFLQATAEGEATLAAAVRKAIGQPRRVADLFAGCGTFALRICSHAEVHAVEGDRAMLDALKRGWRGTPGLKPVSTEIRDLFRHPLQPDELAGFDAIVIDPPRAGARRQMDAIARSDVACVASVSCNPVTFARDAKTLIDAGFRLEWALVVDQFRWSRHVEIAAAFIRDPVA